MDDSGIFITFEGGDGAGKSTQTELLSNWLSAAGWEVIRTFEPGDTQLGREIRALLLDGQEVTPRAEALLFAADRAQHVDEVIKPALKRGAAVICDRYVDSSIAYQGSGRALDEAEIKELSHWATTGLQPQLIVVLDIDPRTGLQRRGTSPDRLEAESLEFHDAVRSSFLAQAQANPERYLVVDATLPADEIHEAITARISQLRGVKA